MEYPVDCDQLVKAAAMPDSMGGHGQPNGRPMRPAEQRDMNHPMGTNERAGLPNQTVDVDRDND